MSFLRNEFSKFFHKSLPTACSFLLFQINLFKDAMFNMARLNRTAGALMAQYGAHGATEVAGKIFI